MNRPKAKPARTTGTTDRDNAPLTEVTEQKLDLLIRELWKNRKDSVHDMHAMSTDAKSYSSKPLEKCVQEAEREKKRICLEVCLQQRKYFSPFFSSVDGFLGVAATATLKRISSLLATEWQQPYLRTYGYVKSMIYITLVQATHQCIQGSRVPAHRIGVQHPQW